MSDIIKRKKLAVLIGGEFREFERAQKSWTFLNDIEHDIYFSTWNISHEINDKFSVDLIENVTEDKIRKYFPEAIINITSDDFLIDHPVHKLVYHWRNLLNMVDISNVTYDSILLIRPDIRLHFGDSDEVEPVFDINSFVDNMSNDIIYSTNKIDYLPPPTFCFINDVLFMGKYNMIRKAFMSFLPSIKKNEIFDIHNELSRYFINNNIYVDKIDSLQFVILRSISRDFENLKFSEERILTDEWSKTKDFNITPSTILKYLEKNPLIQPDKKLI